MLTNQLLQEILLLYSESKMRNVSLDIILQLMADEESQKTVVSQINQLLSAATTKMSGIDLLSSCLQQFSPHIITDYGISWIRTCLHHHENSQNREVFIKTVTSIIMCSQNQPQFNKKFVSEFLFPTLDTILKKDTDLYVKEASLMCLIACLSNYASSCNPYKKKIEEYVMSYLDTQSEKLVSLSGSAYFHCQLIGSTGTDGLNHINNITLNLRKLCVTAHKIFNSIFKDHLEFESFETSDIQPLKVCEAPIFYSTHMKLHFKEQILKNVFKWIMIMLQKKGTKSIYPQEVLNVIRRGISFHVCLEKKSGTVESVHFALILMKIQTELLKLLSIFIHQMGLLLAPFYHIITKVIQDVITRNQSCICYLKDCVIQEHIYSVLSTWLKIGGNGFEKSIQDKLITCIIRDSFPVTDKITLKVNSSAKKMSKMKLKKLQNEIQFTRTVAEAASSSQKVSKLKISLNALNTLYVLFQCSSITVSASVLTKLNSIIIKTLLSIQNGQASFPFNEPKCQLILYRIICTIFEQDSVNILPPIQIVLNILRVGCNNENKNIAIMCLTTIRNLEKICQPVCSSLYTVDATHSLTKNEILMQSVGELMESTQDLEQKSEEIVRPDRKKPYVKILNDTVLVSEHEINENGVIEIQDDHDKDELYNKHDVTTGFEKQDVESNESEDTSVKCFTTKANNLYESKSLITTKIENSKSDVMPSLKRKWIEEDDHVIDMSDSLVDLVNEDYQ